MKNDKVKIGKTYISKRTCGDIITFTPERKDTEEPGVYISGFGRRHFTDLYTTKKEATENYYPNYQY